ncbi:MAG: UDP-N-acetylmuramate dehydrogenase [Deltaproteobacteria bacterium]|nr:UDP-N-acetylmuramate dehydrogenase [Deltaproteobacteria bacterium]
MGVRKLQTTNPHSQLIRFKGRMLFNVPMKEYTSMRIGGTADVIAFPIDEDDLKEILNFAYTKDFPVFFLGAGTNLLVKDSGIRGVVISLTHGFKEILWENENRAVAGAGVKLAEIVNECKARGLSGIEWAVQIPGTIGGAVVMNAGAYSGEIKDVVSGVDVVDIKGNKEFIKKGDLRFSYRSCLLPSNHIITRVHLEFKKDYEDRIEERLKEFKKMRQKASAVKLSNAGCIFKNPDGLSAGKIIDEAGLKNTRIGNAMVSDVHANYIVNLGDAKARDVISLIEIIKERVFKERGIKLEPEIKIIGEE